MQRSKTWMLALSLVLVGAGCASQAPQSATEQESEEVMMEEETTMIQEGVFLDGTYTLNAEESEIEWEGRKKLKGEHFGTVQVKEGQVLVQSGEVSKGSVVVDMTTISSDDLEGSSKTQLEGHLKSDDFFGVDTHPLSQFTFSSLEQLDGDNFNISGTLMIKGIEQSYTFEAEIDQDEDALTLEGEIMIDRTLFDVRYGSGKFFDNLGDAVINDEFTLELELEFDLDQGGDEVMMEKEGDAEVVEEESAQESEE